MKYGKFTRMTNGYLVDVYIAFVVIQNVQTQSRLVVNTTCLELAKPSNQQYRLICSHHDYHCLFDESYTQEFEVCREWKWIPGGKCAYFNTYGSGNVDERQCNPGISLTCSEHNRQFESNKNIQFTACYAKRDSSTSLSTSTSPALVTSNNATSNGDIAKSSVTSKAWIFSLFTGIAVFLSIAAILFIRGYMDNLLCKIVYPVESQELSDTVRNEDNLEQQPFLRNEVKDTSKRSQTLRHEDEITNETRKSDMNESDSSEHFEEAPSSPTIIKQKNSEVSTDEHQKGDNDEFRTNEVKSNTSKPVEVDISKDLKEGGTTADKSDYEEGDTQEKTDVFNDTVEILKRIAHPTEKDSKELCTGLYNLLGKEGLKLTEEVMAATIRRLTGRSVETLFKDLTDQEKSKLKETLSEEFNRIFESKEERKKSVHVLYSLLKFFLEEELWPKSGWGNPVWGKNLGIGDDIERLYRIQTIFREISNPTEISVKSYTRLLDIMYKALIRLDHDVDSKEDFKAVVLKLKQIKNQSRTQIILKQITEIYNLFLKTKSNQCCEEEAK
ncbi:uncharacterized protein LOC128189353 [Crassostrea angulata]|uniref:uncharacterized protein LOC128189353 n=1 Tax=Magallana angulata TaxID=2784310 RepID=UPI0022B17D32|nr:uncharacterized protein LOC128189353 [Crassostrea angulata]